jgi:hypothetical protein
MSDEATTARLLQYSADLGKFWINFNSLEMILRLFLARRSGLGTGEIFQSLGLTVGQPAPVNSVTNWQSFGELCRNFNNNYPLSDQLDFSRVLATRDAMAHGRVLGDANGIQTVIKYSKPRGGIAHVEFKQTLSPQYIEALSVEIHTLSRAITDRMGPYMRP